MQLNSLSPDEGSRKKGNRVGRGIGCGKGKTCGKGHKGQKARAGRGKVKFSEGGQMPIYRRLPKFGFKSAKKLYTAEVRTAELNNFEGAEVTLETLKQNKIISKDIINVKIIKAGDIKKPVSINGIKVTKGAKEQIIAAGGKIIEA